MAFGSLLTSIDIIFVLVGAAITMRMVLKTKKQGEVTPPPASLFEATATLVALACTAVGPNILIVALSQAF